ncbi:Sorting nexin-15 [Merluccius polli]|uniref:Sorting nexin-15 n=1 Tax=Merluccius polli TaxID=89951 RepID=A0AA47NSB2_MERPO|nr:Sorting nexin-15 [Merluccius polli]
MAPGIDDQSGMEFAAPRTAAAEPRLVAQAEQLFLGSMDRVNLLEVQGAYLVSLHLVKGPQQQALHLQLVHHVQFLLNAWRRGKRGLSLLVVGQLAQRVRLSRGQGTRSTALVLSPHVLVTQHCSRLVHSRVGSQFISGMGLQRGAWTMITMAPASMPSQPSQKRHSSKQRRPVNLTSSSGNLPLAVPFFSTTTATSAVIGWVSESISPSATSFMSSSLLISAVQKCSVLFTLSERRRTTVTVMPMSRKVKEEYYRFFTVSDHRTHEKGHTEYKVTARFVSKRHPEDVKEVEVWRRFSELKKLHGELAYTHRNLFRRQEDFPAFPRAQLFGRFEEAVIEERREAAEAMLCFTTNIPALYNSPQLKDFFRGGEVTRPLDLSAPESDAPLPPPLIPLPKRRASDCEPAEEEEGREAPVPPQDLGSNLGLELGEPEVASEAYGEVGGSPVVEEEDEGEEPDREGAEQEVDELSDVEQDNRVPSPGPPPEWTQESQDEFDSLFDLVGEEPAPPPKEEEAPPPLSDNDLAIFDPCCKQEPSHYSSSGDLSDLLSLPLTNQDGGEAGYLSQAACELTAAIKREKEGEFSSAILAYRTAVDLLLTGAQGDPDPVRRESVKKRTAQYLKHVEMLVDTHSSPSHMHTHPATHLHAQEP